MLYDLQIWWEVFSVRVATNHFMSFFVLYTLHCVGCFFVSKLESTN